MLQPWVGADTAEHQCWQYVHHSELRHWRNSGGLIITAHTSL